MKLVKGVILKFGELLMKSGIAQTVNDLSEYILKALAILGGLCESPQKNFSVCRASRLLTT